MAVRDVQKGEKVCVDIRSSTGNDQVEAMNLDLNSLNSVKAFTDAFLARELPVHILVNNAGSMVLFFIDNFIRLFLKMLLKMDLKSNLVFVTWDIF